MLIEDLKSYCLSSDIKSYPLHFARNLLKEYLHITILDYLYKQSPYKELVFYGGTCLRYCFDLPRLSEDLDFECLNGEFDFAKLEEDLSTFFVEEVKFEGIVFQQQKFRLYIKIPILKELGIAKADESDFLNVKIEINSVERYSDIYAIEIQPIFKLNKTFFVCRYDLPTLMSSKINALINRTWSRKDKIRDTYTDVKGRDFYDLLWYMNKKIDPNLSFSTYSSKKKLWEAVRERVQCVNTTNLYNDVVNFLENPNEAETWANNFVSSFETLYNAHYRNV